MVDFNDLKKISLPSFSWIETSKDAISMWVESSRVGGGVSFCLTTRESHDHTCIECHAPSTATCTQNYIA